MSHTHRDPGGQDAGDGGREKEHRADRDHGRDIAHQQICILEQDGRQEHLRQTGRERFGGSQRLSQIEQPGERPEQPANQIEQGGVLGQQQAQQTDRQYGRHHGGSHVKTVPEVVPQLAQQGLGLAGLGEPGGHGRLPAALAGRQGFVGVAFMSHGGDGRHARQDGGDDEGDDQGGPEVEIPLRHQAKGLGHDDHEGGRHGGEAGGDDDGFAHRVLACQENPVGNEQTHRVAADERGHGINGGVAWRAPEGAHHGLHQYADKLQQTEAEQKGEGHGADGHDEAHRHGQLVEQKRQSIRGHQPGRPDPGDIDQGHSQAQQLEQAQYPVDGACTPAAVEQGHHGTISNQQQDEAGRQGALGHHQAGQMIHHYGAAPPQLDRNKEDGDAKQAGQQQLDACAWLHGG